MRVLSLRTRFDRHDKGYHLSEGNWEWNGIKRNGGNFFWKQIYNAQKLGVRTMYGAMWDECVSLFSETHETTGFNHFFCRYDEGTVLLPVVTHKRLLPLSHKFKFMGLDEDGYDLPADW